PASGSARRVWPSYFSARIAAPIAPSYSAAEQTPSSPLHSRGSGAFASARQCAHKKLPTRSQPTQCGGNNRSRPQSASWCARSETRCARDGRSTVAAHRSIHVSRCADSEMGTAPGFARLNAPQYTRFDQDDHRWTEQHDPDRREDQQHHRDDHLNRRLLRFFLRALAPLDAHLVRLDAENLDDTYTQLLCLDQRRDKAGHVRNFHPARHITQGL